ncbi:LysR family transcriptional regulator [Rhodoferax koreense]|uniref:LysR family transcriptional regulator n=1 Tax=Rhodoferax koreensis TaxID=1842727 RepID=A0A1P8JX30_9BURK|nr:LysR family transcriptional regulator [Rhodoferax koreense]APW38303.1 LysR family transcriptional regulator [Rhodoferax koreense]
MNWDDLRFFLEVSRTGRLVTAARRLEVDHTTVSRRITALESALGTPLFERAPTGYTLTEAGRQLLPHAEDMETACIGVQRQADAQGSRGEDLSGVVRVGATEGYGTVMLAPQLSRLVASHPRLVIDLLAVPRVVNLSRREADIVITLERPTRGPFIVQKLTDYALCLYGSADYLAAHPPILTREDLDRHMFIGYVDDLLFSQELHYLDELCRPERIGLRSTSILAQHRAIAAGAGIGVLPAFIASQDPSLRRILPAKAMQRTFWMSMPIEIKHLARMQTTWRFIKAQAEAQQELLNATADDAGR